MKNSSILSIFAVAAAVNAGKVVSTRYETEVYTITSCAPEVTECAYSQTSKVHTYTTECDEEKAYPTPSEYSTKHHEDSYPTKAYENPYPTKETEGAYPTKSYEGPYTTSTVYETKEYTITSCAAYVTDCPVGHVTTTVIASTTLCPVGEQPYPSKPAVESPVNSYAYTYKPVTENTVRPYPTNTVIPAYGPTYSTVTIETCVPTYVTKVITVTGSGPSATYPAGCPGGAYCPDVTTVKSPISTGGYTAPPVNNGTIPYTGSASTQRVGGLLFAVGLAAALL